MRVAPLCAALILGALAHGEAAATQLAVTDLLPTYTGPSGVDLDILTADVGYSAHNGKLIFRARLGGAIGKTPGAVYVFGLDRGAGTARFVGGVPSIGQGVLFDSALVVNSDGTGFFNDLINARVTPLAPGAVRIEGKRLIVSLAAHLVPPAGRAISSWTFNVWPRVGLGSNNQIADFAPDASNAPITIRPSGESMAKPANDW